MIPNKSSSTTVATPRSALATTSTGTTAKPTTPAWWRLPHQNAFPTTDVGGLQAPSQNWLFGVNCSFLGCPPNGGWSTFADLNVLCRPSGDWPCVPPGPVCPATKPCRAAFPTGRAVWKPQTIAQGGLFEGDNVPCTNVECPPASGACCASGVCSTQAADDYPEHRRDVARRGNLVQRDRLQRGRRAAFRPPEVA